MALFSRSKKTEEAKTEAPAVAAAPVAVKNSTAHVLHSPRITEKASRAMEDSVYVFDVTKNANKREIIAAVKAVYKVKPRKVAIVNTKPKMTRNMRTGKKGMKGGFKKAYVYLRKGETITIA
jgi:large subunit ribosomal protein L23